MCIGCKLIATRSTLNDICVGTYRSYRTQLAKGACILVSTSVQHKDAPLMGGVRAVVLASRFLIEPCGSGKSRLTHICRVDTRWVIAFIGTNLKLLLIA